MWSPLGNGGRVGAQAAGQRRVVLGLRPQLDERVRRCLHEGVAPLRRQRAEDRPLHDGVDAHGERTAVRVVGYEVQLVQVA
jgi:hypothetical protein